MPHSMPRAILALAVIASWTPQSSFAAEPPPQSPESVSSSNSGAAAKNAANVAARNPALNSRVLFITTKGSARCAEELTRLRRPGGEFDKMRASGWKIGEGSENHLQIVDRDAVVDLVQKLSVRQFPTVACVSGEEIVRSFQSGCTTPLDAWTFGFLAKGIDERPPGSVMEKARVQSTNHYPLRGNHWSIDGDWIPSQEKLVGHLRGPYHASHIAANWTLESWSYEELRSLHDNLHEQEMGSASYAARAPPKNEFSATRKILGH